MDISAALDAGPHGQTPHIDNAAIGDPATNPTSVVQSSDSRDESIIASSTAKSVLPINSLDVLDVGASGQSICDDDTASAILSPVDVSPGNGDTASSTHTSHQSIRPDSPAREHHSSPPVPGLTSSLENIHAAHAQTAPSTEPVYNDQAAALLTQAAALLVQAAQALQPPTPPLPVQATVESRVHPLPTTSLGDAVQRSGITPIPIPAIPSPHLCWTTALMKTNPATPHKDLLRRSF